MSGVTDCTATPAELLICLRKIGTALLASGNSVDFVEATLQDIASVYGTRCIIIALPNILMVKLGESGSTLLDMSTQRLSTLRLDQTSALAEMIDQVKRCRLSPAEAARRVDQIRARPARFGPVIMVAGYVLLVVGLTLRMRPAWDALIVTGVLGLLVGLMQLWFRRHPRFALLEPVLAAIVVATLAFWLTRQRWIFGPANLIIPPLVTFLPGIAMTTGMIELASGHLISGSARIIHGMTTLLLLFVGITVGVVISRLSPLAVYEYSVVTFPWWMPVLGTLLFGIGIFFYLSGANRDLPWMVLVLYLAMLGQDLGEYYFGSSYVGAFLGALLLAFSAEFIARSPRRTPVIASRVPALWFLVPGARGLLSFTDLLSENYLQSLVGIGQVFGLLVAVSLGILLATLIMAPRRL